MTLLAKLKVLWKWYQSVDGLPSLINVVKLYRAGRYGGETATHAARPIRARAVPTILWARPGTDDVLVFFELFDRGEYASARSIVNEPVRLIVDLGTNVGYSIAFFSSVFPDAHFIGVEPNVNNLAMAKRTLAGLIDSGRVVLHHAFVGAHPRTAVLARGGAKGSNEFFLSDTLVGPDDPTAAVLTIPQLLSQHTAQTVDLLKCDIEGGEAELFSNCADWINRVRNIVIELHGQCSIEWLERTLRDNGADFATLKLENRHEGVCLAWLQNRISPAQNHKIQASPARSDPS